MDRTRTTLGKAASIGLALIASSTLAAPLSAQGWIDTGEPVPQNGLVKVRTSVIARVTGRVAIVEVEEWFRNDGGQLGEGDYIYPLPGEAVFSNFSLYQGDEELRGEMMNADEARSIWTGGTFPHLSRWCLRTLSNT